MATIGFDTLKMVERLESAGFTLPQARMQASVLAEVIGAEDASIVDRFSSKQDAAQDLAAVRAENGKLESKIDKLDSKIAQSAAELKVAIADTRSELIRWMVSVGILQMALVAALVIKLVH